MTPLLLIIGLFSAILGIFGSILPVIPGPTLSFLSLILVSIAKEWVPFSTSFLIIAFCLTLLVSVLDYLIPLAGAKKYGASKPGLWGSVLGMVAGLIFFPPAGIFIGAFLGALAGEFMAGKDGAAALKAGWGIMMGNLAAITLKLTFSGVIFFLVIQELF